MVALGLALAAVVFVAFAIAAGRRDRAKRQAAAATVRLTIDDRGVERELADGRHEDVAWADIGEVRYVVLPKGPWESRGRLILEGDDEHGCIVPLDVAEEHGLLAALGRLPGFDARRLADLLERERVGTTVVWTRSQ